MTIKALVILSGGQDSTTCLSLAIQTYGRENVVALSFDYGQRHVVELKSALIIAYKAGVAHEVLTLPFGTLKGTSPLVSGEKVETYASAEVLPGGLEKTFVPMRNALFLILAANRAVVLAMESGCKEVHLCTGVGQEDYGGYPDCRALFIRRMASAIDASLDDPTLPELCIDTPLMNLSKKQTVELSEGIPGCRELLVYSHTCYQGEVPPCGKCHACLLREKGFREAGVTDPLIDRLAARHA